MVPSCMRRPPGFVPRRRLVGAGRPAPVRQRVRLGRPAAALGREVQHAVEGPCENGQPRARELLQQHSPIRQLRPPPITRTTSPGRVSRASHAPVASTDPGAATTMSGRRAATASARPAAEAIVVRIAAGPDVRDGHRVGRRARRRTRLKRSRAVVRQRFVDGPDAPSGLALAHGRERRPDRGRVVAVVVVDRDAADFALPLEPPADSSNEASRGHDAVGVQPQPGGRRRDAKGVGDVVGAGGREADRQRAAQVVEAGDLRSVPAGSAATTRPSRTRAGPAAVEPLRDAADEPADPRALDMSDRDRVDRPTSPPSLAIRSTPGSPTLATTTGGAPSGAGRIRRSQPRTPRGRPPRREHVRVVPLGRGQDGERRPVRVEVARVLVGLHHERAVRPAEPGRGRRRRPEAQQRLDERRGIQPALGEHVDQPARGRALAVRPGNADEPSTEGRRRR